MNPRYALRFASFVCLAVTPAATAAEKPKGHYSVTGARGHYLRYADGSEELYDRGSDPHEWANLAARPKHAAQKSSLAKHLPDESKYSAPAADASGVKRTMKAKE